MYVFSQVLVYYNMFFFFNLYQVHKLLSSESKQQHPDNVREVRDLLRRGPRSAEGSRTFAEREDNRYTYFTIEKVLLLSVLLKIHYIIFVY